MVTEMVSLSLSLYHTHTHTHIVFNPIAFLNKNRRKMQKI